MFLSSKQLEIGWLFGYLNFITHLIMRIFIFHNHKIICDKMAQTMSIGPFFLTKNVDYNILKHMKTFDNKISSHLSLEKVK